jgi:hypothetical protein
MHPSKHIRMQAHRRGIAEAPAFCEILADCGRVSESDGTMKVVMK